MPLPPAIIDGARVLEYAVVDETVSYSGHSSLYVSGNEIGPVPCLAVCRSLDDSAGARTDVLLFHCCEDWSVLGAAGYASVAEAKDRAARIYPGLASRWIEAPIREEQVADYLNGIWTAYHCSFCKRGPYQVKQLFAKDDFRICDSCIREFHEMLEDDS